MNGRNWILATVFVLMVIGGQIAYAATGTFSSSSSAAALTATNSGSGRAINATSGAGYAGVFTRGASAGTTPALQATSKSGTNGATALYGYDTSTGFATTYGVWGRTLSTGNNASGVYGLASATSGDTKGVFGQVVSPDGEGVYGVSSAASGDSSGVLGANRSSEGSAISAIETSTVGATCGVCVNVMSGNGRGVDASSPHMGVLGFATGGGSGVIGVYGAAVSQTAPSSVGVFGESASSSGFGMWAAGGGTGGTGINATGNFAGVLADGGTWGIRGAGGIGVLGLSSNFGVLSNSDLGIGHHLVAQNGDVSGSCSIAQGASSQNCTWPDQRTGTVQVIATPQGNPGSFSWVDGMNAGGFTLHLASPAPAGGVTFAYLAIWIDAAPFQQVQSASNTSPDMRSRM